MSISEKCQEPLGEESVSGPELNRALCPVSYNVEQGKDESTSITGTGEDPWKA